MTAATDPRPVFPDPPPPRGGGGVYLHSHEHDLVMVGARLNPNGTWSSVWTCSLCPDVIAGALVGPIPPGWCRCGWVQREPIGGTCEECDRRLGADPARPEGR